KAFAAAVAVNSRHGLLRSAPARNPESEPLQLPRRIHAEHAESEHADLHVGGLWLDVVVRPDPLTLLALVTPKLAQVDERMQNDPFTHPVAQVRIDRSHDRLLGQERIGKQKIDASAKRKDRLQIRQTGERARRMSPAQRVADRAAVERLAERCYRARGHQLLQPRPPGRSVPAGHREENAQETPANRATIGSARSGESSPI